MQILGVDYYLYINVKNNGEDIWILKVDNKFFCVREITKSDAF